MKKYMLILLVSLFPAALVYADANMDLTRQVTAAVAKAEMEAVENEAAGNPAEILQQYVDLCDGNKKLGKILYDARSGKTPKANALGRYVIWKESAENETCGISGVQKSEMALTGFVPFQVIKSINHYYPDGIWTVENGAIKHTPGPLVGVLKGSVVRDKSGYWGNGFGGYFDYCVITEKNWNHPFGYIEANFAMSYTVYNENNEIVFNNEKIYNQIVGDGEWFGEDTRTIKFRFRHGKILNELNPLFDNEEEAQKKAQRQKKIETIKKAISEKKEELFH